jgi:RimJ/RimL family protein N-acetyltransferase
MNPGDRDAIAAIAAPADLWKYFPKELNQPQELDEWMKAAFEERADKKRMPFSVINKETGQLCGCTSFMNISFYDKRLEIGSTWLGLDSIGSGINHHAKFALMSYAFEGMKFERIEFKTDKLNARSRAALVHIGAAEEGTLRSHMLMPHGRRRDSVYYSIIREDWQTVKMLYFVDLS